MANSEKIDDIIDERAFKQLERLLNDLGIAQGEFAKLATAVEHANTQLSKTQGFRDLEKNIREVEKATKAMQESGKKSEDVAKRAAAAEKEVVEASKARLLGIQEENKLLNSLSGSLEAQIKAQVRLKAELSAVREEQKKLNDVKTGASTASGALAGTVAELAQRETELKAAIQASNLDIRRAVKEANAAEGSYDEMSAKLDRLRGAYRSLNEEERNNVEIGGALLASIQEYDKNLKDLDATMGVHNRNVGNYSNQVQDALEKTGLFNGAIARLTQLKRGYEAAVKVATVSTRSFGAALVATGIGAIILLLGGLISFLTRTQRGMDLVAQVTDAVATFMAVFLDVLANIAEQIFDSVIPALKGTYEIMRGIMTLDFDRVKNGFEGIRDAVNGINSVNLIEVANAAGRAAAEAARLRGEVQQLDKEEARLAVTQAERRAEIEKLREASRDESLSIAERQNAVKRLFEIENENEQELIRLKQERLRITKEQNALTTSTEDDLQKERDLQIEISEIEANAASRRRSFLRDQRRLNNEASAEARRQIDERVKAEEKAAIAAINLEESRLKRAAERTKKVADDEQLALSDRLSNLQQYLERQEEIIMLSQQKQLMDKQLADDDIIRIEEETQEAILNLKAEGARMADDILKKQMQAEDRERAEAQQRILAGIEQRRDEELLALNEKFAAGEISEEEYARQRLEIQRDFTRRYIEQEIRAVEAVIEANRAKGIDVADQERQLAALRLKLSQETSDRQIEDLKKVQQEEQRLADLRRQMRDEVANAAVAVISAQYEKQINQLQRQGEQIDINRAKEIERVNASVAGEEEKAARIRIIEARAQSEREEVERRQRRIQEQQAKFERDAAVAKIIANTAAQVIAYGGFTPPAILMASIGAAQLARVLATPIPRFEKGTDSSPEGLAIVGEKGPEGRINPDGSFGMTPGKPTLTYLEKGTKIIPTHDMKRSMVMNGLIGVTAQDPKGGSLDTDRIVAAYQKGMEKLEKAYSKRPQHNTLITKSGIHYIYKKGFDRKEYLKRNLS